MFFAFPCYFEGFGTGTFSALVKLTKKWKWQVGDHDMYWIWSWQLSSIVIPGQVSGLQIYERNGLRSSHERSWGCDRLSNICVITLRKCETRGVRVQHVVHGRSIAGRALRATSTRNSSNSTKMQNVKVIRIKSDYDSDYASKVPRTQQPRMTQTYRGVMRVWWKCSIEYS